MKTDGSVRFLVWVAATLLLLAAQADPSRAADNLSSEMAGFINGRIETSANRDLVFRSASAAVDSGLGESLLTAVMEKALDRGVSAGGLARMIDILSAARGEGLPSSPYTGKIMEGLAKGVDENRIVLALERVHARLELAARLARGEESGDRPSGDLVVRTADAVAAGMNRRDLEEVFAAMAGEGVNRNIEPEEIMELVKAARGYGVDSRAVRDQAISLMKDREADMEDVRKILRELSEKAFPRGSERDDDGAGVKSPEGRDDERDGDDDGDDHDTGEDGIGHEGDGEHDGETDDGGPEEDDHEDDEHDEEKR